MNWILFQFLDQSVCVRLVQTLLHFLWQGLAIGLGAACLVWLCRTAGPRVRYAILLTSLVLMSLCVPITFTLTHVASLGNEGHETGVSHESCADVSISEMTVPPTNREDEMESAVNVGQEGLSAATKPMDIDLPPIEKSPRKSRNVLSLGVGAKLEFMIREYSTYATAAYFLGVFVMLGRLCAALWGGHRLRRCAIPISDRKLLNAIRSQATRIGLKVVPIVACCERIAIPVVAGIIRPMILLPVWMATEMDPEHVMVILAHEMAHIRRLDLIVNLLQRLLETVLFFHPAIWYVSRQLSFERENCCDDAVVQAGHARVEYASALLRMVEVYSTKRGTVATRHLATLAANGGRGSQLKRRILRLLSSEQRLRITRADSMTIVLTVGLILGMLAGFWRQTVAAPTNDSEAKSSAEIVAKEANSNEVEFIGKVVDAQGQPVPGAEIWFSPPERRFLAESANEINDDDEDGKSTLRKITTSSADGSFSFRLEPMKLRILEQQNWTRISRVVAKAPGYGIDRLPLAVFEKNPARSEFRDSLGKTIDARLGEGRFEAQSLKLQKDSGAAHGRIVDLEGNPIAGVKVLVHEIQTPNMELLSRAFEQNSLDLRQQATTKGFIPWNYLRPSDWQVLIPSVTTNSQGEFSLNGLGLDQLVTVTLFGERVSADKFFIVTKEMETKGVPHSFDPHGAKDTFVGLHFDYAVGPAIPVSGIVTEFQSGKPIPNAKVYVERLFKEKGMKSANQLRFARHIQTVTDGQGRYQLVGIPPGRTHVLNVVPPTSEPWLMAEHDLSLDSDQTEVTENIQVFRGIWMEGRVTDESTGQPIKGGVDYLALRSNPNIPQRSGLKDAWQMGRFPMDETGHYRVAGLPGPGVLFVQSAEKTVYPLKVGAEKVPGYEADHDYLPTTRSGMLLVNWQRIEYVDPPFESKSHTLDLTLSAGPSLAGRVVGPNGALVSNIEAFGANENGGFYKQLMDGQFTIYNYQSTVSRNLFFKTADEKLVGHLHVEGTPPEELTVTLQPSVTVRGRLFETELDDVAVGYGIGSESSKLGKCRFDNVLTDSNGCFEVRGMIAGNVYKMYSSNPRHFSSGKNDFKIDLTNAKPGDVIELGDVTGKNAKPAQ